LFTDKEVGTLSTDECTSFGQMKNFVLTILVLLSSIAVLINRPRPAIAQNKIVTIEASQLDPKKMPYPGKPLVLSAELQNTRDFNLPVRLLAVRDGKLYEVAVPRGVLSVQDRPQYQVSLPAPLAEISYQFIVSLPDGNTASSKRYIARRSCLPDTVPAEGEIQEDLEGSERFNQLLVDNKRLEREIDNLERAASELDALSELISP
jgi:hypothetical protein